MRNLQLENPDIAGGFEAVAITEDGGIIPTTSVRATRQVCGFAEKVILKSIPTPAKPLRPA